MNINFKYPQYICFDCAAKVTNIKVKICTVHTNICPICGYQKELTECRDFKYPNKKNLKELWLYHKNLKELLK